MLLLLKLEPRATKRAPEQQVHGLWFLILAGDWIVIDWCVWEFDSDFGLPEYATEVKLLRYDY